MKRAIIFDIDGVLAKISKNEDGTPKRGYRDYDKVDLDERVENMRYITEPIFQDFISSEEDHIILITGRKELCRIKTIDWFLSKYEKSDILVKGMNHVQANEVLLDYNKTILFMRPDNDHRKAVELKKEIYQTQIKGNYDVIMAFDDDPEVCKMYKEQGILTLQVMTRE